MYRYIPGLGPHPRRNPRGHSFGEPEPTPRHCHPDRWHEDECYLYGVDLYNHGFWWESHEVFEALWHGAGRTSQPAQFFRGLIQIAASNLKAAMGSPVAARNLCLCGIERLRGVPSPYMGLDVVRFIRQVNDCAEMHLARPPLLVLGKDSA